jgi:hypothetical protein
MPELAVHAPALVARQASAPRLTITDDPGRWCAVEIAVAPGKLGAVTGLDAAAGWASWEKGLVPPGTVVVPDDAWATLRTAEHLYYRAHSSAAPDAWVDHRSTLMDGSLELAPSIRVCDAWTSGAEEATGEQVAGALAAAATHADFAEVSEGGQLAALVSLHRFSPKRPMDPSQLEWAVLLAAEVHPPGEVRVLVQRLEYTSLALIASRIYVDAGSLAPALGLTAGRFLSGLVGADVSLWPREERGPFLILRNNSPAPEEEGGTCVVVPATDRCVYYARTKWHGTAEVAMPG